MPGESAALDQFVNHYSNRLKAGDAALFAGAGLSVGAGHVDWRDLLRDVAEEIELDIDIETDLVAVAQYHVNTFRNRATLNRRVIEAFAGRASLSENHRLIARLPLRTIWTTNYDNLIEQAYDDAGKLCQPIADVDAISTPWPRRDVALYKMHGDIRNPAKAVITKDDYETYRTEREEFITVLTSHLLTKTFLFIGFSFSDPNLDYLLAWIRSHRRDNPAQHYWITKELEPWGDTADEKAEFEYLKRKQTLRMDDMNRYGIRAIRIKHYDEITDILTRLSETFREQTIFVSGSAHEYGELGHARLERLTRSLTAELIRRDYRILTGFGLGVGGPVILGAVEGTYMNPEARLEERVLLRPFDLSLTGHARAVEHRKLRHELLEQAGFAVFISGNRLSDGTTEESPGVFEEFELAVQHGVHPIPIGATGYAARTIWERVSEDLSAYFGEAAASVEPSFRLLGDSSAEDEELIGALLSIIDTLTSTQG